MPQKSNNPWDPNQSAGSPIPQDKDDELEMAEADEDMDDDEFDDEDDVEDSEVEED
jgi:hypothetical protein